MVFHNWGYQDKVKKKSHIWRAIYYISNNYGEEIEWSFRWLQWSKHKGVCNSSSTVAPNCKEFLSSTHWTDPRGEFLWRCSSTGVICNKQSCRCILNSLKLLKGLQRWPHKAHCSNLTWLEHLITGQLPKWSHKYIYILPKEVFHNNRSPPFFIVTVNVCAQC